MQRRTITADVMTLLEYLLGSSNIRLSTHAKPIIFETPEETWCFDPHAKGPLLRRGADVAPTSLRIRCSVDVLARLVTDTPFTLSDDDPASFAGDLDDFLQVAAALEEATNALNLQFTRKP